MCNCQRQALCGMVTMKEHVLDTYGIQQAISTKQGSLTGPGVLPTEALALLRLSQLPCRVS
jgi:hypothetical protein